MNNNTLNNSGKPEAKKRQRRSGEKSNENHHPSDTHHLFNTPIIVAAAPVGLENSSASTPRFIKSANYKNPQNSSGYKLRFFRNKSLKEIPTSPATLRRSSILDGSGYCMYGLGSLTHPHGGKSLTSPSPVFNMRYKSMTNLVNYWIKNNKNNPAKWYFLLGHYWDVWEHRVWYFRFKRFRWQDNVWGFWWRIQLKKSTSWKKEQEVKQAKVPDKSCLEWTQDFFQQAMLK